MCTLNLMKGMTTMKIDLINACSDLGVHVNGADKGPKYILKKLKNSD